jgi:hypothetical protein
MTTTYSNNKDNYFNDNTDNIALKGIVIAVLFSLNMLLLLHTHWG